MPSSPWQELSQRARDLIARFNAFVMGPPSRPDLVKAQCTALSRLIPLMYIILVANSWVLAINFFGTAPRWLTIDIPVILSVIAASRVVVWWRMGEDSLSNADAVGMLKRTNYVAGIVALTFSLWALTLFPYGDALTQSHVAFYMALSVIGCILCLMHLRSAALIVMAVVTTTFVAFFASTGNTTFVAMAINVGLITGATLLVILLHNRTFARMVSAQSTTERKHQEQYRLLRMMDDMPAAVMTVDPHTFKITYVNETSKRMISRIEDLLPINADELLGASIDVFHKHPEHQRKLLADPSNLPHRARIKVGPETLDLQVTAVNATDGSYLGPMLTWSIVTQQVAAESRIRHLALFDTLTGLANRATFHEKLEESLAGEANEIGLLFMDLDGFKIVNDSKGHRAGDILLKQVTRRLRSVCRDLESTVTIARLGGDEFAILTPHADPDAAGVLAGEIVDALATPFEIDHDRSVRIGASIGIALAPLHGRDAETLLSCADMALYAAKASGRGNFKIFSPLMEKRVQDRVRLETELRVALEESSGLFVFYQPIVSISTGRITAREALLRWHHPRRGWIPPSEFIPVAEDSGLIDELGLFVLDHACREAATWTDGARVAVNVSPGQLGKNTLAPGLLSVLFASGLPPDRLEVEVTESALLNNERDGIGELRRLHDMGIRVALDDFGTGFSSLSHLRAFPFDKIKIDGSFVRDAVERPDCAAVVRAVADVGQRLGVTTVAEGVETDAQYQRVKAEGCSEVQGFLFGRPAPSKADAPAVAALEGSMAQTSVA